MSAERLRLVISALCGLVAITNLPAAMFTGFLGLLGVSGRLMDAGAGENQKTGAILLCLFSIFAFNLLSCFIRQRSVLLTVSFVNASALVFFIAEFVRSSSLESFLFAPCSVITITACLVRLCHPEFGRESQSK
jgi:hypothetical protein